MIADESVSDKPGVRAIINSLAYAITVQTSAHTWPPFLLMAARRCNSKTTTNRLSDVAWPRIQSGSGLSAL